MWNAGNFTLPTEPIRQEYVIKEHTIKCRCGFHDGYDRDCFEAAQYSIDSTPVCAKHLHIRMRAITMLILKSPDRYVLVYNIK
jgi:hypothetical protein